MANEVRIRVSAQDAATSTLDRVRGSAKALGSAFVAAGAVATAALAGIGVASVKMAVDFDRSIREVKTLLPGLSDAAFGQLQDDALAFSKQMGITTGQVVPALYQAISAGVPRENVFDFLATAAKASIGGVTELEIAVDGLTSAVNAYGAETLSAQQAADIMFTGVRLGKTDFEQLSASLFNVLPTASALGVGFGEITAALATMTAQGVPTTIATTQLRAALVEASKGGTTLDKAIRELTGKTFAALVAGGKGATEVFQQLRDSLPEQEFKDLFGSVEALNAVLQITGPNLTLMQANLDAMGSSGGAADAAFEEMERSTSRLWDSLRAKLQVALIEIGQEALPLLNAEMAKFSDWWDANGERMTEAGVQMFSAFIEGAGLALRAFAAYIDTVERFRTSRLGQFLGLPQPSALSQLEQSLGGRTTEELQILQEAKVAALRNLVSERGTVDPLQLESFNETIGRLNDELAVVEAVIARQLGGAFGVPAGGGAPPFGVPDLGLGGGGGGGIGGIGGAGAGIAAAGAREAERERERRMQEAERLRLERAQAVAMKEAEAALREFTETLERAEDAEERRLDRIAASVQAIGAFGASGGLGGGGFTHTLPDGRAVWVSVDGSPSPRPGLPTLDVGTFNKIGGVFFGADWELVQ